MAKTLFPRLQVRILFNSTTLLSIFKATA